MVDQLSNLLSAISINQASWSIIQLSSDGGFSLPKSRAMECFFVIEGSIHIRGANTVQLSPGRAVLFLHHDGLSISPTAELGYVSTLREPQVAETVPWLSVGDGEPAALIARVCVEAPILRSISLFRFLPDIITTSTEMYFSVPMCGLNGPTGMREMLSGDGGEEIGRRLAEFLLVQILRSHIVTHAASSYDDLVAERRVAHVIKLMHTQPAEPWTVSSLAEQAGMSRAAFAKEFTDALGETPIRYLTHIRMMQASEILRNHGTRLSAVAHQIGYSSNIAFVRAFKKHSGLTPAQFRGQQNPEEIGGRHFLAAHPAFVFDL